MLAGSLKRNKAHLGTLHRREVLSKEAFEVGIGNIVRQVPNEKGEVCGGRELVTTLQCKQET